MRLLLPWLGFWLLKTSATESASLDHVAQRYKERTGHATHLPIVARGAGLNTRRSLEGSIGLGDFYDITYNVLVKIGGITTPLLLDTGSSDLWILSDRCFAGCSTSIPLYPQSTFQSVGLDARLVYGDSTTGTHAYGPIGKDTVDLTGITLPDQYFAAINDTNTNVTDNGSTGIFGLGFPINSLIWHNTFSHKHSFDDKVKKRFSHSYGRQEASPKFATRRNAALHTSAFPNLTNINNIHALATHTSQTSSTSSSPVFRSFYDTGPLLSRLVLAKQLPLPIFTITLQRDTVDIGGNVGLLSIGQLPDGIHNDSMTWVSVRSYPQSAGGLAPPVDSPGEIYPLAWEVEIDDVFLDGQLLPRSQLSDSSIQLTALIDTGNSLIRGPADVVDAILNTLGMRFPCSEPHTLAFQIGGHMFPIDPRDFAGQVFRDTVSVCSPNLVSTDPPGTGGYMFSWSLGIPFLKSVLSSYYYGNLTYPSQDPPRIGLLSTVPVDAGDLLKLAVQAAIDADGNFPSTIESAPTGTPIPAATNSNGVPETKATVQNGTFRHDVLTVRARIWVVFLLVMLRMVLSRVL